MAEDRERADGERPRGRPRSGADPTLRGLLGAGPSRVGPIAAMRARDVARPTEDDLRAAEKTVVIRRRPPDGTVPAPGEAATGGTPSTSSATPKSGPAARSRRSGGRRRGR